MRDGRQRRAALDALANALARLTPASGPPPRIPSGFGGCVGGFGPVRGRKAAVLRPVALGWANAGCPQPGVVSHDIAH